MSQSPPYNHLDSEQKWQQFWEENQVYSWKPNLARKENFVIDTPPPTVSGSLHVGHVFSYTQTDILARFQRMRGKNVFYPMGWDDNGLPTERRVQNVYGISCNPSVPYEENWKPQPNDSKDKRFKDVSRKNFIEACEALTKEDEKAFEAMWRNLGLSIDWTKQYATIDTHCRKVSQASFLDLVEKGQVYQNEAPTMWDIDFKTAVAQAEIEDRICSGAYHHIPFQVEGGGEFTIATTRPELLPACIAVVAHPDDERYKPLFGKKAITPLFHAPVPILPADHADPEKGTGILMVCTFGDAMDVEWWKQSGLPAKAILSPNGRLKEIAFTLEGAFPSLQPGVANENYAKLQGLRVNQAKKAIVELLALSVPPQPMEHPVKFYEKGESPVEFMTTRQWFIRILEHKTNLIHQGHKIHWHPEYMKSRYINWVEGLNQDWCISRQRYFGVPFPVWYPLNHTGEPNYAAPIFAAPDQLPVDPLSDPAPGYSEDQRNQPNGFIGDPDVMDTWATSSLTPQLTTGWPENEDKHQQLFPADIRPQSHEIIRTWAFYTIVKAWMHHKQIPWKHVLISGWILDPDRKKMSKSKGNVVTPDHLLKNFSADAVRYWAARARLGTDTAFDESVFGIGKKLVTKLVNASKFVLTQLNDCPVGTNLSEVSECLDKAWIGSLMQTVTAATQSFEQFDYAGALEKIESAFWYFCDHYIELVKGRAYQETGAKKLSALITLDWSLHTFLTLFAPFIPFVTEEIWSWRYTVHSHSVHRSPWPSEEVIHDMVFPSWNNDFILEVIVGVLSEIRAAKTKAQKSMKYPVEKVTILTSPDWAGLLEMYPELIQDLSRAGTVKIVKFQAKESSEALEVQVQLADMETVEKIIN